MESYYSRFYKMMNEMIRTNLEVATMQYQKGINKIRVERIAKNTNPLALVAATQQYPDPYYQAPKPQRSYDPAPKQHSSTRSNVSTRHKGKEIAKPIIPLSKSASKEDSDPKQAQKDKEMQKTWAHCKTSQFGNQKTVTVVGARETVCNQVVQQTGIQCFNCKEFGRVQETKKGTRLHVSQGEDVDVQT
ncbi:hypothetical protein Tco_0057233, partial [Tanacetum coccineum]